MPDDKNKTPPAASQPSQTESLEDNSLEPTGSQPAGLSASSDPDPPAASPKAKGLKKFSIFHNLYLIIFILLVLAGGAVVMVSLKASKPQNNPTKTSSLTDQQISSIKGNTTLVGDAKQTLDVQSNSIFEGQVLLRSDLSVAGGIKIGGTLSIPSITVGGQATVGQLGVNGGLNVGGDTTLQGQLTVQKNLAVTGSASFGSLNVSSLALTTLQLKGDINLNQHIVTSGGVPGRTNGTALGSGGSASVGGSDTAGTVTINTGGSPPAGCFITVNFAKGFSNTPHVVISPSNSQAAGLQYYTNRSNSGFSVCTANVPAASSTYIFDYVVVD
jgi:cytoskeletal protein CcmA (bactofilin family)